MNTNDVLLLVNESLKTLNKFNLDVLNIAKPKTSTEAAHLCKIISKLSPIVGNLIEFRAVDFFNEIPELSEIGRWKRQDPGFPDAIFDSSISPAPGIEIKAWFPLATEMTARFKDSQKFFSDNQTYVLIVCWLPEHIIYGKPVVIGTSFISGKSIAETRDNHYFNPPDYLILEPENTESRTANLQQTNTNGYKIQENEIKKAMQLAQKNKLLNEEYSLEKGFQTKIRELFSKFNYRLDTNYAKIDRIQHLAIEEFKSSIMNTEFCGLPILKWSKIIANPDSAKNQKLIKEKLNI